MTGSYLGGLSNKLKTISISIVTKETSELMKIKCTVYSLTMVLGFYILFLFSSLVVYIGNIYLRVRHSKRFSKNLYKKWLLQKKKKVSHEGYCGGDGRLLYSYFKFDNNGKALRSKMHCDSEQSWVIIFWLVNYSKSELIKFLYFFSQSHIKIYINLLTT